MEEWLKSTTQETTGVGEDVEKGEPSCTVVGNANWYSHCGEKVWRFLKKLEIELPYNPGIALLGIYPKNTKALIQRDTCTPIFTGALFTIAKLWKQPKCPWIDELGAEDVRYVYTYTSVTICK